MNIEVDHQSKIPLHIQVEEMLRKLIQEEKYKKGACLPKEVYLSEHLKISRNTIRQAINRLVSDGLLTRKKGVGTFVLENKIFTSSASNWLSFSQEMKRLGIKVHNFELHISWQEAPKNILSFFKIDTSKKLLTLERLRGKEDFPFVYFISMFNPEIPLNGTENFNAPLYELLEKDFNIRAQTSQEEISAKGASDFLAKKLNINIGDPILVRKRQVYDDKEMPIEYNIGYYRADSFTYAIECKR